MRRDCVASSRCRQPSPASAPVTDRGYSGRTVTATTLPSAIRALSRVDLNLLIALDTLLRERSVTQAASRLGLSQPALSASLARLRRYFDDELLTRVGNKYELTPLAVALLERTTVALAATAEVFTAPADFDPATAEREFELYVSDYAASVLATELSRLTRAEAPTGPPAPATTERDRGRQRRHLPA